MNLDNPVALLFVILVLLLLVISGFISSVSIIFAYLPEARDWAKALIDRLLARR